MMVKQLTTTCFGL